MAYSAEGEFAFLILLTRILMNREYTWAYLQTECKLTVSLALRNKRVYQIFKSVLTGLNCTNSSNFFRRMHHETDYRAESGNTASQLTRGIFALLYCLITIKNVKNLFALSDSPGCLLELI